MHPALLRILCILCLAVPLQAGPPWRTLDAFEDVRAWTAAPSDGVALSLAPVRGHQGGALRMTLDFKGGAGYAAMRRPLPLQLPANYEISFWLRGNCPPNTLEFKLVDGSGENVWWVPKRDFRFPSRWTRMVIKKRHVEFAWGPAGGGEPERIAALELAVTAGSGGRGWVEIDALAIRELPALKAADPPPVASASEALPAHPPALASDGRSDSAWRSAAAQGWFQLDFQAPRELGGLVLHWDADDFATDYEVQASDDGRSWRSLHRVRHGAGGSRPLALPETETRFLRLACTRTSRGRGWGLREVEVQPLAFAATPNRFIEAVAKAAPRGDFPRCFIGEQPYWTLLGVDGGPDTGLLGEDGALEPHSGAASVEPFLWSGGRLLRWSDVVVSQSLAQNHLPIPSVDWKTDGLALKVTAFGTGATSAPVLRSRYRVTNRGPEPWTGALFLALRPFQVNPPIQFLGAPGGVSPIRRLDLKGRTVRIDRRPFLWSATAPDGFGASAFDRGSVTEFLHRGQLPPDRQAQDPTGLASGALRYDLVLAPGQSRDVYIDLPVRPESLAPRDAFEAGLAAATATWAEKLNRVTFNLPDPAVVDVLRSCLAHILISRRGPALQPGTRSYTRSWIRDGALISAGLLRLGHPQPVREFIDWYSPYLFASGKVPCVVDKRGADPVPEHDSHGEFIYLVAEYDRFQRDAALLGRNWPQVRRAWSYLDQLIQQRRTPEYQQGDKAVFFGLVPESISHEGYSAKPRHSYWDDFFTLRGLKDAGELAARMGDPGLQQAYRTAEERFRADFMASIRRSMAQHRIDYIPGCAELGDFDATSTTIGLSPGGELASLPRGSAEATFEAFYQRFLERKAGRVADDRYTPYETRIIGSFFQLGWAERGHELIDFYLQDLRPRAWNQWPEVVQRGYRTPVFLGDLPHAWVGSDFIRSFLTGFAYEREQDRSLVLGAGLREAWLRSPGGAGVAGLRVAGGTISFQARAEPGQVSYQVSGTLDLPPGGIVVPWPLAGTFAEVTVNGRPLPLPAGREVVLRALPAEVVMRRSVQP